MTLTHDEIAARYRQAFGLADDIGYQQALDHWNLERRLTEELLQSKPDERWETFSRCYTQLYDRLPWLNQAEGEPPDAALLRQWSKLIPAGASIFEVGSGKAELLKFLSGLGFACVGTEITKERGERHVQGDDRIVWHQTDGIHLSQFEPAGQYDLVISNQVIEHMHPSDVGTHFAEARKILKPGGSYIFTTPHVAAGPHDLSRIFGIDQPVCMHLREYDHVELEKLLKAAGFTSVRAVFPPRMLYRAIQVVFPSRAYFLWLRMWDSLDRRLALSPRTRRTWRGVLRYLLVPTNIWISATR